MRESEASLLALLVPAFIGLIVARQIMLKLGFSMKKYGDAEVAYSRIQAKYFEPYSPIDFPVAFTQDERVRCYYRGLLWAAFAVSFLPYGIFAIAGSGFGIISMLIGVAALAGSVQQFWSYWRWQNVPGQVVSVDCKTDHLIVLTDDGDRHVYVFDGSLQVMVSCEQDLIGVWPLKVHHRTELIWSIKDGTSMATFPYAAQGCGPLLALCRQSGAKVDVLADTPMQKKFAEFTREVDSCWVAQPNSQRPKSKSGLKVMACSTCGAKSSYDSNSPNRACEYCGSPSLTLA